MVSPLIAANEPKLSVSENRLQRLDYFRKKWSRNYTDYGLWISIKKSFAYLLQPIYQQINYYLYELDLNKYAPSLTRDSKYDFRLVEPGEPALIDQIEEMEEWLKGAFREKLQNRCLCMAVMDGEKVIGFNYASIGRGTIPLLKLHIITGPTEAWSEQITISSDYRRQGLGSLLRSHFYQTLKDEGITALYGHRQEFNIASKQSAKKFTAGILARTEYRRIFGLHRLTCIKPRAGGPSTDSKFSIRRKKSMKPPVDSIPQDNLDSTYFTIRIEDLK